MSTTQEATQGLRAMVRGTYNLQKLRIQMGNRIVGNFKVKLGQEPGKPEADLSPEDQKLLEDLRSRYRKLTDGVVSFPRAAHFLGDGVITTWTELCLLDEYVSLHREEERHFRRLGLILNDFPIWTEFLKGVTGIGPAMAGVIVSEIDIAKARYPSSLWKYAGLDVGPDGRGRSKRKEHLVRVEYTNKDGNTDTRDSITYNPFLKTKLMGVLASSFLRCKSPYAEIYALRKARLECHARYGVQNDKTKEGNPPRLITSKGRRHQMAMREMVKRFLVDLYVAWRGLEGLEVQPPYEVAKLGLKHVG